MPKLMRQYGILAILLVVQLSGCSLGSNSVSDCGPDLTHHSKERVVANPFFIQNVGQHTDPGVRYYIQHPSLQIAFADGQVRLYPTERKPPLGTQNQPVAWQATGPLHSSITVSSRLVRPRAKDRLPSYSNHYKGPNPDRWRTGIPHYARLNYNEVYPGIDLIYFFNDRGQLTFEYHVKPGADPAQIELTYSGIDAIERQRDGGVAVRTEAGVLTYGPPLTYQKTEDHQEVIASAFAVNSPRSLTVQVVGGYDPRRELVIDPTLTFSTYWGSGGAVNRTVAIDHAGNIYMSGGTKETDWPTTLGPPHCGGSDVAVAKFTAEGTLLWSTLLGGPSEDYAYVSAVSDKGELYVSGRAGKGFPATPGAFDRTFNGGIGGGPHEPTDAFVVKFSPNGEIIYSTYIGGNGDDNGRAIHLLPSGKLIVGGGNTTSTNLPTEKGTIPGPVLKPERGGDKDSWVAVLAPDGGSLEFLTYFGPSNDQNSPGDETIRALGVDVAGNIWIGGTTSGSDITPTPDAFQKVRGSPSPSSEAYIAKLSPDGKRLMYFSWLGGNKNDEIETEGVSDKNGNFYVAGSTASTDFPTSEGAFQSTLKGSGPGSFDGDGWVAKITNDGNLGFATLYGGTTVGPEGFFGPVVDLAGNVYCTGRFGSDDVPVTPNAFQPKNSGKQDAVLAVFSPDGKRLLYGSYFGGSDTDHGRHIGIDPNNGAVSIIGETRSTDLPLVNPYQRKVSGVFWATFILPKEMLSGAFPSPIP